MISTAKIRERAVLVGLATDEVSVEKEQEYIDELAFLAETAETDVVRTFIQKAGFPQGKFYVGSGKLQEIKAFTEDNAIDTVIFDDELSPAQLRNIEGELKLKVLDRTTLIFNRLL